MAAQLAVRGAAEEASLSAAQEEDALLSGAGDAAAGAPHGGSAHGSRALRWWALARRAAREEPLLFRTLGGAALSCAKPRRWRRGCHAAAKRNMRRAAPRAGVAVGIILGSIINSANGGPLHPGARGARRSGPPCLA
jgi:hypothetical protein